MHIYTPTKQYHLTRRCLSIWLLAYTHYQHKYYSLLPSSKNDYWLRPFIAYETMGVWQHVQCDTHTQILECLDLIARFLFSETLGNFITMYTAWLSSGNVTTLFCCLKNTNEKNECNIFIEKIWDWVKCCMNITYYYVQRESGQVYLSLSVCFCIALNLNYQ